MAAVHRVLMPCRGWGEFMGGQVVGDLLWTPLLDKAADRFTWAPLGPGSRRGINRLLGRKKDARLNEKEGVVVMRELWDRLLGDLGPAFDDLTLMDAQSVCCEYDKVCRVLYGEKHQLRTYEPETRF